MTSGYVDPLIPLIDQALSPGKAKKLDSGLRARGIELKPRQAQRAAYKRVPQPYRAAVAGIVIDWLTRSIAADLAAIERTREAIRVIDHQKMVLRAEARRLAGDRARQDLAAGSADGPTHPALSE